MRKQKLRSRKKSKFSEDAPSYADNSKAGAANQQTVELGAAGRLVIPAPMRAALGMKVGDRLTVRLDGEELRIHTYAAGIRRMQDRMRRHLPKNAVDEFLRWKRQQAAKEEAGLDRNMTTDG
jgi:AbrB family looped-hinge helix DNA binding protein